MLILDLIDDILLTIIEYLDIDDVLSLRHTCRKLSDLSRVRSVWLNHCNRILYVKRLPFIPRSCDKLDTCVLEKHARRARRLEVAWTSPAPWPRRELIFEGGPLNCLRDARFVLREDANGSEEYVLTLCEGIWPVVICWDLKCTGPTGPRKVGEWVCPRRASILELVVNVDQSNQVSLALQIEQNGQQWIELQRIVRLSQPCTLHNSPSKVSFQTIKTLQTGYKPVYLNGNMLVICNEHTETRVINWRTEHYSILQNSDELEENTPHDKCLQVFFAHQSILVARARSVDLFPMVKLYPPEVKAPAVRPLQSCSFGWIDGISIAPTYDAALQGACTYPALAIFVRAESGDPWASNIHSLNRYILFPNPDFVSTYSDAQGGPLSESDPNLVFKGAETHPIESPRTAASDQHHPNSAIPYIFPPKLAQSVPARRGFMRCPLLTLGAGGTALWIGPSNVAYSFPGINHSISRESPVQTLGAAIFPGPLFQDNDSELISGSSSHLANGGVLDINAESARVLENRAAMRVLTLYSRAMSAWTSIDYVESRGCIALGTADGYVVVLYMG